MERKGEDDRTEWLVFIIFIDNNQQNLKTQYWHSGKYKKVTQL